MPATESWARCTVLSPAAAALAVSEEMLATRCALSAIWREVASSSLMVVVISLIAVACSRAPVACCVAVVCSSAEELETSCTAEPIWRESSLVNVIARKTVSTTTKPAITSTSLVAEVAASLEAFSPIVQQLFFPAGKIIHPFIEAARPWESLQRACIRTICAFGAFASRIAFAFSTSYLVLRLNLLNIADHGLAFRRKQIRLHVFQGLKKKLPRLILLFQILWYLRKAYSRAPLPPSVPPRSAVSPRR